MTGFMLLLSCQGELLPLQKFVLPKAHHMLFNINICTDLVTADETDSAICGHHTLYGIKYAVFITLEKVIIM